MNKRLWIQLDFDDDSSQASIQDLRPYIERMVSFSIDSPSKHWDMMYNEDNVEEFVFVVEQANCRKLFIGNKSNE
jgi:hypothetical protein